MLLSAKGRGRFSTWALVEEVKREADKAIWWTSNPSHYCHLRGKDKQNNNNNEKVKQKAQTMTKTETKGIAVTKRKAKTTNW